MAPVLSKPSARTELPTLVLPGRKITNQNGRANCRDWRIHRTTAQHGRHLAIHLPGLAETRAGVV